MRILVDKKIAKHLDYEKKYHGFVSETTIGDAIEMTFLSPNIEEGFSRWYMMFGDHAAIIEPESLKERVLELMRTMAAKLD